MQGVVWIQLIIEVSRWNDNQEIENLLRKIVKLIKFFNNVLIANIWVFLIVVY